MTLRRTAILTIVVLCLWALPAAARTIDKHYHEEFPVERGGELFLHFGDGDVTVTAWDRPVLDVEVRYLCDFTRIGAGRRPSFEVEFKRRGNTIEVVAKESGGAGIGFFSRRTHRFDINVKAPEWLLLELTGDDGDVSISDWRATIECSSDDGDLTLENIECEAISVYLEDGDLRLTDSHFGTCFIEVEDGEIRIKNCAGDFDIRADDGSVVMHAMSAGEVTVETSDGDVSLSLLSSADLDIDIRTDDGDIDVRVDGSASAEFEIETDDGDIDVDGGVTLSRDREHRKSGILGDGVGRISISSDDGDIRLEVGR